MTPMMLPRRDVRPAHSLPLAGQEMPERPLPPQCYAAVRRPRPTVNPTRKVAPNVLQALHADTLRVAEQLQPAVRPRPAPREQWLLRMRASVRDMLIRAIRQRMATEMADLAGRIRKLHDAG